MNAKALGAEFIGTFALVTATCGAALFSAPSGGGLVGVSIAIGLSVLMMAYAVGHVSGGHFNPAVTLGLVAAGRFDASKAPLYIAAQVLGGIAAAAIFSIILSGQVGGGKVVFNTFAAISNTFGAKGGFSMTSAILIEVVITALFLIVIVGSTSKGAPVGFAPLAIGVALMVLHLVSIPVTNASLNPARSTAPALFAGGEALAQLWVFWVAPIVGGIIGGIIGRWLQDE
ncbi:MAG: aquaporin Z [Hyphomicrobium sp.]|nr:aquaporin Z [Hyphomicrobium sp.]PPC84177.1 MAG: aquaporin Z [Hyphomicrobium sp.]